MYRLFCPKRLFLRFVFILLYSVLNTLQNKLAYLHIKKHYFSHFCCLFLKLLKPFSVSLSEVTKFCTIGLKKRQSDLKQETLFKTHFTLRFGYVSRAGDSQCPPNNLTTYFFITHYKQSSLFHVCFNNTGELKGVKLNFCT